MSGDLSTTTRPGPGTLALRSDQSEWSPFQLKALEHLGIVDAGQGDLDVFRHVAQRTGLDPFSRQIYMIGRRERDGDSGQYKIRWTIQTGIDGFRVIAERHQMYAGQLEPLWCGQDGKWLDYWPDRENPPVAARIGVLRHDWQHPVYATVHFEEFAARYKSGGLMPMWNPAGGKPAHMIGKVAEAHALRKAFPQDLSGLYTDDEMAHVDHPGPDERGRVVNGEPVTAADLTAGAPAADDPAARLRPEQMQAIIRVLREVDLPDRWGWVSAELGRLPSERVGGWGELTVSEADQVIAGLERLAQEQAVDATPVAAGQQTEAPT